MDHLPARIDPGHPHPGPHLPAAGQVDLVRAFLSGRKPTTLRAYQADLADFARFLGTSGAGPAVELLLTAGQGPANAIALDYRADLMARGLASATVARRLAAPRSMVKLARTVGRVAWALDVEAPKAERYRDTAGPGRDGWRAILAAAAGDSPRARRDRALIRLLHDRGLRRGEAVGLDRADADLAADPPAVAVLGKGRSERERLTINGPTAAAIGEWMHAHPDPRPEAPLFVRLDRAATAAPERLTGEAVRLIVADLGRRAGLSRVPRPHGLRHRAITQALDDGFDVRDVVKFSRHRDVRTLLICDDRRKDVGGAIARRLGGE